MTTIPPEKRKVAGSIPALATTKNRPYQQQSRQRYLAGFGTVAKYVAKPRFFARRTLHISAWIAALTIATAGCATADTGITLHAVTAPAGTHTVGRIDTEIDNGPRQLMVSAWYPATGLQNPARYVPALDPRVAIEGAQWLHTPNAAAAMIAANVTATETATPDVSLGRLPVVLMSPGLGTPRWNLSGLAGELASRGYIAVVMDHTGEAPAVGFPDGHIVFGQPVYPDDSEYMMNRLADRLGDTQTVLDRLTTIPTVGPMIDTDRIAMAGHSYGGLTAVQTMAHDKRVKAAVVLDGSAGWQDVITAPEMTGPVLLLSSAATQLHPSWSEFTDPRFDHATIIGGGHYSATDLCGFGAAPIMCGTVDPARATMVSRNVIESWLTPIMSGGESVKYAAPELEWQ